jgi:hypothetical protein
MLAALLNKEARLVPDAGRTKVKGKMGFYI